VPFLFKKS